MMMQLPDDYVYWFKIRKINIKEFIHRYLRWYTWEISTPRHTYHQERWEITKRELQLIKFTDEELQLLPKLMKKLQLEDILDSEYNWPLTSYIHDTREKIMRKLIMGARMSHFEHGVFVLTNKDSIEEIKLLDPNFDPHLFLEVVKYSIHEPISHRRVMDAMIKYHENPDYFMQFGRDDPENIKRAEKLKRKKESKCNKGVKVDNTEPTK